MFDGADAGRLPVNPEVSFFTKVFAFTAFLPPAILFWIFHRGAKRAGVNPRPIAFAAGIFFLYLAALGAAAQSGAFARFDRFPPFPGFPLVIVPIFVFAAVSFLPRFTVILAEITPAFLIGFQVFRLLPETLIFLLHREGAMPVEMTIAGRNFDILVALSAPIFAWLTSRPGNTSRYLGLGWNIAALIVLGNTVATALLSMPTPMQKFAFDHPNTAPLSFPFYLLPAGFVVTAVTVHILSLRRFWIKAKG